MTKVLVVDDIAVNRELVTTLLGYNGYACREASDGAEALALVRAERPDLVICDILMPTMDGYEFVRQLRSDPAIAHTRVIYFTAHYHERQARSLALKCGVSRVLAKPCDPEEILTVVTEVLGKAEVHETDSVDNEFDRDHVRLMTDKLSATEQVLRDSNFRLAALTELNVQLASERDPVALLHTVCRAARELLGARYAVLRAEDRQGGAPIVWTSGIDAAVVDRLAFPNIDTGLVGEVRRVQGARRYSGDRVEATAIGLPPGYPALQSSLIAPVVSLSHCYGWICLADKLGKAAFDDEDEKILSILGAQVGRIYENGSLYVQIQHHADQLQVEVLERQQAERRIRRLNRVYAVLSGINTLIVRVRDRDELFREACRIAVEQGELKAAWIGTIDEAGARIMPVASWGMDDAFLALIETGYSLDPNAPLGNTLTARAVRERTAVVSNDIAHDPRVYFASQRTERGILSKAVLPLSVDDEPVGTFSLFAAETGYFDDEEVRLLNELAGDIGFALNHIEKEEALDFLAYYDVVTRLPNLTLFRDRLAQAIGRAQADQVQVAVYLFNLSHFSRVNDTLGRRAGDAVLRMVAERLTSTMNASGSVARLSGDTFAIAIEGALDPGTALEILKNRILSSLGTPLLIEGHELRISGRAGIALFPSDGRDGEELLKHAELALKLARAASEPYLFFAADMNAKMAERLALETELRAALEMGQFRLHYQPIVELDSGQIVSSEALLRWQHPQKGLLAPGHFIAALDDSDLAIPVGDWVLQTACRQIKAWQDSSLPGVTVSVNISARQFLDEALVRRVSSALEQSGLEARFLGLELTEGIVMSGTENFIAKLDELKALGVSLALDDFGTGYSSLSYLKRFPIDHLKIDQSFVREVVTSADDSAIVRAVISVGHSMGLQLIAEGVETVAQLTWLRRHRCELIQGYYFSRPVPAEAFAELLRSRKSIDWGSARSSQQRKTLLIVDDESNIIASLVRLFRRDGYQIITATSALEAFELLALHPTQVIISDHRMPQMTGAEFLARVKSLYPDTVRILFSGQVEMEALTDAVNRGAVYRFLLKPWDDEVLRETVKEAFHYYWLTHPETAATATEGGAPA